MESQARRFRLALETVNCIGLQRQLNFELDELMMKVMNNTECKRNVLCMCWEWGNSRVTVVSLPVLQSERKQHEKFLNRKWRKEWFEESEKKKEEKEREEERLQEVIDAAVGVRGVLEWRVESFSS